MVDAPPAPAPAATPAPAPTWDLDDPALYANRELSWLDFNDRVFAEATDERNPLLERVRFLAITSSNLDEFCAKRVGWLKRGLRADRRTVTVDGLTLGEQLDLVMVRVKESRETVSRYWQDVLCLELEVHNIRIVPFNKLDDAARAHLTSYFQEAVFPVLTPLVVDPSHPFPFISGGSLSLALNVRNPHTGLEKFARVKVPQNRPRLLDAGNGRYVFIEDVIAAHSGLLFPGMEVTDWHALRVIRSADIGTPGEEAEDLLELIENELRKRRLAEAVYLEIGGDLPAASMELLLEELELTPADVVVSDGALGLADLSQLASLPIRELAFPPFTQAVPSAFSSGGDASTLFAQIRERDILVHHPYESFSATVVRFIEEAAADPAVLAIKQTMYRTSPDSEIFEALIDAAGRGKQVAVLVELTARFDEANNIEWARKLEDAGVHVAYGDPALKIHSKIALVVREEMNGVTLYAHIGTGNYNRSTARLYTDFGLFTVDKRICSDLVRIFNYLTGYGDREPGTELLVAPASLRSELGRRVRREIDAARRGQPAIIIIKMNALEDREFSRLLYEASQAGVQVDLIVRGICRVRPGLAGLSENLRVRSVIGRFLEHSRVFYFHNGGQPEYFIGSADLMKRNLDERIEVVTPVHQRDLQAQLREFLDVMLADERQAWVLRDRGWTRDSTVTTPGPQQILLERAPFS